MFNLTIPMNFSIEEISKINLKFKANKTNENTK